MLSHVSFSKLDSPLHLLVTAEISSQGNPLQQISVTFNYLVMLYISSYQPPSVYCSKHCSNLVSTCLPACTVMHSKQGAVHYLCTSSITYFILAGLNYSMLMDWDVKQILSIIGIHLKLKWQRQALWTNFYGHFFFSGSLIQLSVSLMF